MSLFVQQHATPSAFTSAPWVILTPIEQRIKEKIEAVGTPLKDWDIQINYGIKTGYNEAFIISTEKRDEILANCQTEEERQRTADLIRPILRGRDIKRYGYDWAGLWLIFIPWHFPYQFDTSINGASEKAEKAFQEQYPSVYQHMTKYKERLSKRNKAETGIRYEWYAMQRWGAQYWEDFDKPKVVWNRIASVKQFAFVQEQMFIQDSMHFIVGSNLTYLCSVLNSKIFQWLLSMIIGDAAGGNAGNANNIMELSIPPSIQDEAVDNEYLYSYYNLSEEEIHYIESQVSLL